MDEIARKVFHFEGITLDVMRRSVRRGNDELELRPKSFDVLCYLAENAGRPVSKDAIITAVWPKVIVTDESLTRCVSDVRSALGDSEQQIIKTIPRYGYLLAAPLQAAAQGQAEPVGVPAEQNTNLKAARPSLVRRFAPHPLWPIIASAALVLVAAIAFNIWRSTQPPHSLLDRPSIAVLPFVNIGGDPQQNYFADGLAEDLTTGLSKFANLFVIASGSAFKYRAHGVDARTVGRELGVRYLLQGSVRRDAEQLRITVDLVDTGSGQQLWADRYDRTPSAVFAVQDDVLQQIISKLVARISKQDLERSLRKPPETLAAYDYYLQGNALMHSLQGEKRGEAIAAARSLYEQSTAADPRYAPAVQGLAQTYMAGWVNPSPGHPIGGEFQQHTVIDRALSLAERAVELDGDLAEAHATLAWILFWQDRINDGLAEFDRAFELNPNLADSHYGIMLIHAGRASEALDYTKRIMRLDPFYPAAYLHCLGKAYYFLSRSDEAIEQFQAVLARVPGYRPALVLLAAAAAETGRSDTARSAVAELLRIQPDFRIRAWLEFIRLTNRDYAERLAAGLRKAGLPD